MAASSCDGSAGERKRGTRRGKSRRGDLGTEATRGRHRPGQPIRETLYFPQQEARGKIVCTGGCLSFWFPVHVTAGAALHAPSGVTGVLGRVHRPGGLNQLTYNGKPLYTFRLDQAPGQIHSNNFTDRFGGTTFTWHAVSTSGAAAGAGGQQGNSGGYSYPSGTAGY